MIRTVALRGKGEDDSNMVVMSVKVLELTSRRQRSYIQRHFLPVSSLLDHLQDSPQTHFEMIYHQQLSSLIISILVLILYIEDSLVRLVYQRIRPFIRMTIISVIPDPILSHGSEE